MTKLILPASHRRKNSERVGVEVAANDQGYIMLSFERPIQTAIYTPQEAAELARALAVAAQDQAKHGGNPLKGLDS